MRKSGKFLWTGSSKGRNSKSDKRGSGGGKSKAKSG